MVFDLELIIMILIKKVIYSSFEKYGYKITKKKDFKYLPITDYSQALYSRGKIYFEVETNILCNFNQFFFGLNGWHYHTNMVKSIMENYDVSYHGSILEKYYSTYQPQNFRELYFTL